MQVSLQVLKHEENIEVYLWPLFGVSQKNMMGYPPFYFLMYISQSSTETDNESHGFSPRFQLLQDCD